MEEKARNIERFLVMSKQCKTCPFRKDKQGKHRDNKLVARIQIQSLKEGNQICHRPRLEGKTETHLCRGARDYQLEIFHRLGILDEPTDKCWAEASSVS